jgi:hypothetical protein
MRAGGGKQKGSSFEREVCRDLSLWVSRQRSDDLFWRSAMSGGRATVRLKKGKKTAHQAGDICAVHPDGNILTDMFFIECKFYADLQAASLLFGGAGKIISFWQVCCQQAQAHGKLPMLILRQNRYPALIGLDKRGLGKMDGASADLVEGSVVWTKPVAIHLVPYNVFINSRCRLW